MAGSVNKVILVGNLGRDPESRRLNNGGQVVNLRVATSESWRDKGTGERQERTEWHSVVIYNENLAKIAEQYLKKGSKVYIEGQLQTRKWQDQSGVDKYTTEVVLQRFRGELTLLDRAGDNVGARGGDDAGDFGSRSPMENGRDKAAACRAACLARRFPRRWTTRSRSRGGRPMAIHSNELTRQVWQALQRIQNRVPNAAADADMVEQLKALGLVEEKGGRVIVTKSGNRLLAQGRQHG